MQLWVRRVVALASFAILVTTMTGTAVAQGVTSASITGTVTQDGGQPLVGATVVVTNTATGQHFQVVSRAGGRFGVENLPPGGPYMVEVRAIGFQAGRRTGIRLELGQRFTSDFALSQAVVQVEEVTVQGQQDPLINRGRTGTGSSVSSTAIASLPSLNRNFTDLIVTSPQVVAAPNGGPSVGGTNNRFNNIQIDGSINNDLFGLGSTGAPGGQNGGRPISTDAVQEFQILVAPYDVRQGGFTGGLVNAVTKSGTNTPGGTAFLFYRNENFATQTPHPAATSFDILQFGATYGGPIVRDKIHYFVSAERQTSTTPYGGLLAGVDFDTAAATGGLNKCSRVAAVIDSAGFSAGSCGGFNVNNPNTNLFGKITAQTGTSGMLELSTNYAESDKDFFSRSSTFEYFMTGGNYHIHNTTLKPVLKWTNIFSDRFNNEFITSYSRVRDTRDPVSAFPDVKVITGAGYTLVTGSEENSQANFLSQDVWELTDNLNWDIGKHRVTVGTHNEFFGFTNVFFPRSVGLWTFNGVDSLEQHNARSFERNITGAAAGTPGGRSDGPLADFNVNQWGLYGQDQWSPFRNLNLTVGLRADIPTFPLTPPTNPTVKTIYNIDTGVFPSGNTLWSPRLGFNYDVGGTGDLIVRGGAGVFSGRPPYVWVSNAFANSGLEQSRLFCNAASGAGQVPIFTLDPNAQPTTCRNGATPGAQTADINFFQKDFKFPQTARFSIGADKRLPWGMVASADFNYSSTFKALDIQDHNLTYLASDTGFRTMAGEGGRILYGDPTLAGNAAPTRVSGAYRFVLGHSNTSRDYSYQAVFQLQKRISNNLEFNAGYTYSRAYDLMSLTSSVALSNYGFAPIAGPFTHRTLRPSYFDRPNSIKLSGTWHLPENFAVSLTYVGVSGSPYAYVVNGDVNFDGVGGTTSQKNDLFYVPKDTSDISFSTAVDGNAALKQATFDSLNNYINKDACLASQRGKIMDRTSCRNPWIQQVNARLSWSVMTYRGQKLELTADVFNLLHLLNNEWGLQKQTSFNETTNIVQAISSPTVATRYDAAHDRNRYRLSLPVYQAVDRTNSRAYLLLGGRYTF